MAVHIGGISLSREDSPVPIPKLCSHPSTKTGSEPQGDRDERAQNEVVDDIHVGGDLVMKFLLARGITGTNIVCAHYFNFSIHAPADSSPLAFSFSH